jgi:hypothetical protein
MRLAQLLRRQAIRPKTSLPFEIVKDFQAWLSSPEFEDGDDPRKRTGSFYPAALHRDCDRAQALEFLKAPRNFVSHDPRLQITFEFGNAMHERLQALFKRWAIRKGWEFVDEVRIGRDTNRWFISGRVDGDFYIPITDRRLGVEFKTINNDGFKSLYSQPLKEHRTQGNIYLGLAPNKIDEMHFIYVNKNTSAMKEFAVYYDKGMFIEDVSRLEEILLLLQRGRIPKCHRCARSCPFFEFNEMETVNNRRWKVTDVADAEKLNEIRNFEPKYL